MIIKKEKFECLAIAKTLILQGSIVIIPTDTIYGFSALINHENKNKLEAIKHRPSNKGLIYLIRHPSDAFLYIDCNFYTSKELSNLVFQWPNPLTIIFKGKFEQTVAFRCPNDYWLQELLLQVSSPIFSTSANISGEPNISTIEALERTFGKDVPLIVDGGELNGKSSTIIDASSRPFKVIREGSYKLNLVL